MALDNERLISKGYILRFYVTYYLFILMNAKS